MANTINTRIVLRNDELSAWEDSSKVLLKGEVAFAKLSGSDEFEMRVGTGDKTWNQLSDSNVVVPDSTKFYEKATLAELEAITGKNGDIGVVKELIADDKYSYTAYRWDKIQAKWVALDGNYNAGNVYFDSDISLAGSYTSVGNIKLSDGTFSTKGKNLETILNDIFDKTVQPSLGTAPSNSITLNNKGYYEVGETVTPTYTVTYTQGKYNTPWNGSTVNDGTSATSYAVTGSDGSTSTAQSGSLNAITITDTTAYSVSVTTTYSNGTVAKDNKGNDSNPVVQRSGSTTASASSGTSADKQIKPYRYWYIGCTTNTDEITESVIKGLTKFKTTDSKTKSLKASGGNVTLVSGAKRIIVALPTISQYSGYDTLSNVSLVSASNTPITDSYKQQANVKVSAYNGASPIDYKIYVYQPDAIGMDEHHSITVA